MISALSLHAVTKRFGGLVAINRLEYDQVENQVMGLIEPNG